MLTCYCFTFIKLENKSQLYLFSRDLFFVLRTFSLFDINQFLVETKLSIHSRVRNQALNRVNDLLYNLVYSQILILKKVAENI